MEYLDFELRVGLGTAQGYSITVVRSPAGEVSAAIQLPMDNPTFITHLQTVEHMLGATTQTRRTGVTERQVRLAKMQIEDELATVETIGRMLFDALLPAKVLSCYRRSRDVAQVAGKGLRLRLRIDPPELAMLPWEFLFDADEGDYVSLNQETPLTRYLELDRAPTSLTIPPPVRILGMVASPLDLAILDIVQEK